MWTVSNIYVFYLSGGWICPAGSNALLHPVWLYKQQREHPEGGWGVHRHSAYWEQIHDKVDPTHQLSTVTGTVLYSQTNRQKELLYFFVLCFCHRSTMEVQHFKINLPCLSQCRLLLTTESRAEKASKGNWWTVLERSGHSTSPSFMKLQWRQVSQHTAFTCSILQCKITLP